MKRAALDPNRGRAGRARGNGTYLVVPAVRGRQAHPLKLECPDCGAQPDHKCMTADGFDTVTCHLSRRRLAIRVRNAEVAAAKEAEQRPTVGKGTAAEIDCPLCGTHLRCSALTSKTAQAPSHTADGHPWSARSHGIPCAFSMEEVPR